MGGCGTGVTVMLAAFVVLIPILACFLLPQADIPGRVDWALRRGTIGPAVSLIPNDYLTTGFLATVFFCTNVCSIVLAGIALEGRARVRAGGQARPARYWAALAGVLVLYGALGFCASNECAVVGPGGFAARTLCFRVTVHRWPEVAEIRRLHAFQFVPSRQIDGGEDTTAPGFKWLRYKVVFADGTLWESANSRNWAWPIVDRAMRRASGLAHVPIRDYRQR